MPRKKLEDLDKPAETSAPATKREPIKYQEQEYQAEVVSTSDSTTRKVKLDLEVDTRVYVVTAENYDSFVEEFTAEHGELAYVVLSMKDYENLAINIADLRRYIEQQTEIIVYYEEAVKPDTDSTTDK